VSTAIARIGAAAPINIEAEQALLGAILMNGDALAAVSAFLDARHFGEPIHAEIYQTMGDMTRLGKRVSLISIRDFLNPDQRVNDLSLWEYMVSLAGAAVSVINAAEFGFAIKDMALRRGLSEIGHGMAAWAQNARPGDSPAVQIAEAEARLYDLSRDLNRGNHRAVRYAGQIGEDIIAALDAGDPEDGPVTTGLHDLDRLIGGLRRGNLTILAGRPGMMKTGVASSLSLAIASRARAVLFLSLDMPAPELVARMLTDLSWSPGASIAYEDVLNRRVERLDDRDMLTDASRRLKGLPVTIDPQPGLSIAEIIVRARRWADANVKKQRKLGAIAIDHLGKIRAADRRVESRHLELGEYTNALVDLAQEIDCPILLLCQLNRAVEGRDNKRPTLADLRESGRIEEDAAQVIGVYRQAYYLARQKHDDPDKERERSDLLHQVKHDMDLIVLKNRHGAEGVARIWVDVPAGAVRNKDRYS
jgi:replicative DNA helicase